MLIQKPIVAREELGDDAFREAIARATSGQGYKRGARACCMLWQTRIGSGMRPELDVLLHPEDGPYWQERSVVDYDKIKIPAYVGCCWGMYPIHLARGIPKLG